jgi:tetratricopeptide (TPR) repeat protein
MSAAFVISWNDGQLSSALHTPSGTSQLDQPRPFVSPLSQDDLAELAWYYETYPINAGPSGHFRAARVEAQLPAWGSALFHAIMPRGSAAYQAWQEHKDGGASIWLAGRSAEYLSLPWELARTSNTTEPIGECNGITRALDSPHRFEQVHLQRPRRVLLVISRPEGTPSISFLLFARDLLEQMKSFSRDVEVEVLRPPTFEAFCERIQMAETEGRPFDIVHFDGHGAIKESGEDRRRIACLTFETPSGGPRHISAASLLDGLGRTEISLFVIAACHSGEVARSTVPESSVASLLIDSGRVTSVVAMSYAICADAVSLFLGDFYEAALRGKSFAKAMSRGRRRLTLSPARRQEHGSVDLRDSAVPVLYARAALAFEPSEDGRPDDTTSARAIGVDGEYFRLERHLRICGTVAIDGMAGIGKTVLARDFANWLAATTPPHQRAITIDAAGCRNLAELTAAVSTVLDGGVQLRPVVIDGLECIRNWSPTDQAGLLGLMARRPLPRPAVILVGRSLADLVEGIPVLTLAPLTAATVRKILPPHIEPTPPVLEFLDGHPGCTVSAMRELPGARFPVELGNEAVAPVRAALATLGDSMVRQLRLVAGHGPRLEFQSLKHLTGYFPRIEGYEAAKETVRDGVAESRYEDWEIIAERCCAARLAERITGDIYRLHPALGPALADSWRAEAGASFEGDWAALRDRVDDGILATAGQLSMLMVMGTGISDDPLPGPLRMLDAIYVQEQLKALEPRIKAAIARSIARGRGRSGGLAAQALGMLWTQTASPDIQYCDAILGRLREVSDPTIRAETRLLRFVAVQQLALNRFPSAADPEVELREMLAEPEDWGDIGMGMTVRGPDLLLLLAITLDIRGRPADAEPIAREAVAGFVACGDAGKAARARNSLATILRSLGRNSSAFVIEKKAADDFLPTMPFDETELANKRAINAFDVGDRAAAMQLQLANLQTADENPRQRARSMHELGLLYVEQNRLDDAERWLLKALATKESLLGPGEEVRTLLALGDLAVRRKRDDEAEQWFLRVRNIAGTKDSTATDALICLAGIAVRRGDLDGALHRVLQAFVIYAEHGVSEDRAVLGQIHSVLLSETSERIEDEWRNIRGVGLSPQERLCLAECLARIGLEGLAANLTVLLQASDDPGTAARALILKAKALLNQGDGHKSGDPLAYTTDALAAAEVAMTRLEAMCPPPRDLVSTLGVALSTKAAILCSRGDKAQGTELAVRAVELLQPFREGPGIEHLMDYASANHLLGMVSRDLGDWARAADSHLAEAEAYRICIAGNPGFLPRRFEALHHAISSLLKAGDPERALSHCMILQGEMKRSHPASAACDADPPMGIIVQAAADALTALGEREAARKLLTDRLTELDAFTEGGSQNVVREYTSWSLSLLQMTAEPDPRVAKRLRDVLAASVDLTGFRPEHSNAMALLIWECLRNEHREVGEILRVALMDMVRRVPDRADVAAAAARADFDFTLGQGAPTTPDQDEAIVVRLRAGVISDLNPQTALRLGLAVQHAVVKRVKAGYPAVALALAQEFEDVVLPHQVLHDVCRDAFFGCRRNLAIGLSEAGNVEGALSQVYRILEIATATGETAKFDGEDHVAVKSPGERSAGRQVVEAVSHVMARLAEAKETVRATKLLLTCLETIVSHPSNDLVIAAAFAGCSNLLMRASLPLQSTREIYMGLLAARRRRPDSALLKRAFGVGAMGMVFAERTLGDIAAARGAFDELVGACDIDATGMLVAQVGLGLAKDLGRRGNKHGLVGTVALMLPSICRCRELGPAIDDLAGAIDFSVNSCLETEDFFTATALLEAARTLRETYTGSAELTATVATAIANLIGCTRDAEKFKAWLSDLRALDSGLNPQIAEIRQFGFANAILGAGDNGLPDLAEDLYTEAGHMLGAEPKRPLPPALAPAFNNRIAVLRQYDRVDRALDELLDVATTEQRSPEWLTAAANQTATLAAEVWGNGTPSQRDRLSKLVRQLWGVPRSRGALQASIDKTLLEAMKAGK